MTSSHGFLVLHPEEKTALIRVTSKFDTHDHPRSLTDIRGITIHQLLVVAPPEISVDHCSTPKWPFATDIQRIVNRHPKLKARDDVTNMWHDLTC